MFINDAFAQAAGGSAGGTDITSTIIQLALIFVIFYLLLIRPQQKKIKQHEAMLTTVKRGDKVLTGGGIVGTVEKVVGDEIEVTIAKDVTVKILRATIRDIVVDTDVKEEKVAAKKSSSEEKNKTKTKTKKK